MDKITQAAEVAKDICEYAVQFDGTKPEEIVHLVQDYITWFWITDGGAKLPHEILPELVKPLPQKDRV